MGKFALPGGLESLPQIREFIGQRRPAFFVDVDGTLAPVAARPELVELPAATRDILGALAEHHLVCIVSGRGLADLRAKVALPQLYYAADHGHRMSGPPETGIDFEVGPDDRHDLEAAAYELDQRLRRIEGAIVETKGVSLSVHYRLVDENLRPQVAQIVREVAGSVPGFRLTSGKLVHELVPQSDWDKGRAVTWLLRRLRLGNKDTCPICLGDDLTDENMFAAVGDWGVSLVVGDPPFHSQARFSLVDHEEVARFLQAFVGVPR